MNIRFRDHLCSIDDPQPGGGTAVAEPPAAPSMTDRVGALRGKAEEHYQLTGDLDGAEALQTPKSDAKPDSSTGDQPGAASTEDRAQTEPDSGHGEELTEEPKPNRRDRDWVNLRKKQAETERELIATKAKLDVYERARADSRKPAPAANADEPAATDDRPEFPDMEKFQTVQEFNKAVAEWKKADTAWVRAQISQSHSAEETKRTQHQAKSDWDSQLTSGRQKFKDFDAVALNDKLNVSQAMANVIQSRKDGYELLYHIGKHPDVAKAITDVTDIPNLEALLKSDPARASYLLGQAEARAEARFESILAELKTPPKVPPKPKPTSEVSVEPKGSAVEDEVADAVKRGDFASFERLENKKAAEVWRNGG